MTIQIDGIYYGEREAMMAECGTNPVYPGAYLVQIMGDAQWDAEGFDTLEEARESAKYLSTALEGGPHRICRVD